MSIQNIAVIGANGFIAQHLCLNLSSRVGTKLFQFGRSQEPVQTIGPYSTIDLVDEIRTKQQFENINLVYYLASETYPITSWNDPQMEIEKNLIPFMSFMKAIIGTSVKKVVYVSSAGTVYGTTKGKVSETYDKAPFSPYGIMKLTMEHFLRYYQVKENIAYEVFRISNVYGPGQITSKGLGIINTFIERIVSNQPLHVFGDGSITRNYIYVKDVAALLAKTADHMTTSAIYNLASNDTCSINDLIAMLKKQVDKPFEVHFTESRQSDNSFIDLDNTLIRTKYPNFTFTPLEKGIQETYHFIKSSLSL